MSAKPPFRADHVGSLLRPEDLIQSARDFKGGMIDINTFNKYQDKAIDAAIELQESLGLKAVTDGEFRRRGWSAGFIDAVEGYGLRHGNLTFKNEDGVVGADLSPFAKSKLRRTKAIIADDFRYIKDHVKETPKITIPSPPVMHYFLGPDTIEGGPYDEVEEYYDDLINIYRDEVEALAGIGCTYLQLDDTAMPCNCDETARKLVVDRGEDPEQLTRRYADLINAAIADRPDTMTVTMHLCRGNMKGNWMASGGYEPIAEVLFNEINVDAFFLEYDTDRAGDFQPLRHLPKDKKIVLGLMSTKTVELEEVGDLRRRVDEAAQFASHDQLCLSPQCGFSSAPGSGQVITQDDQKRKIARLVEAADTIWDDA